MAIRFDCICGHHLKARDEMAGRRTMCPACGAPVGVPSLQPTHRGADASPAGLRVRRSITQRVSGVTSVSNATPEMLVAGAAAGIGRSADEAGKLPGRVARRRDAVRSVRLVTVQERRRAAWRTPRVWDLETRWHQCLKSPLRELPMLVSLAAALTFASVVTLWLLPRVLQGNLLTESLSPLIIPLCFWLIVPLYVMGHACMFLSRVAAYAVAGEVKYVGWPDLDPAPPLRSLGRWAGCFLSGPALPSWAALWYWLHCGTLALLDWIILAELLIPAAGYWAFAVLLASSSDRMADANPLRVIAAIRRLGSRAFAAIVLAFAILFFHLILGMVAIEQLHGDLTRGVLLIGLCWLSALYCSAFMLRLVGLWYNHVRRHMSPESTPRWAIPGLTFVHTPISGH